MIENRQVEPNSGEPRIGIAPFAGGFVEETVENEIYKRILIADILLPSLGKGVIYLGRLQNGELEKQTSHDEQAFTIDLSGETHTGKLRDFINAGYYMMKMGIINITEARERQQLPVNVWIDQTEPVFSANIDLLGFVGTSDFSRTSEGIRQSFVLPNSPAILQTLRINISTKE